MATTANLIVPVKQGYQSTRYKAYPQRALKPAKKGVGFDPKDLTLRLEAVLVEQKTLSEKRKAAMTKKEQVLKETNQAPRKSPAPKNASEPYRHKPQVAAADFSTTATSDATSHDIARRRRAHKIAIAALRINTGKTPELSPTTFVFDLSNTKDREITRTKRNTLLGDRNRSQRNRDSGISVQSYEQRQPFKSSSQTFGMDLLSAHRSSVNSRPFSMGDLVWEYDEHTRQSGFPIRPKQADAVVPGSDRQDWAQLDEIAEISSRSMMDRMAPLLRKTESLWTVKSKHGLTSPPDSPPPVPEIGMRQKKSKRNLKEAESSPQLLEIPVVERPARRRWSRNATNDLEPRPTLPDVALKHKKSWRELKEPASPPRVAEVSDQDKWVGRDANSPGSPPPMAEVALKYKKSSFLGRFSRRESRAAE